MPTKNELRTLPTPPKIPNSEPTNWVRPNTIMNCLIPWYLGHVMEIQSEIPSSYHLGFGFFKENIPSNVKYTISTSCISMSSLTFASAFISWEVKVNITSFFLTLLNSNITSSTGKKVCATAHWTKNLHQYTKHQGNRNPI